LAKSGLRVLNSGLNAPLRFSF